uniref:hypothetical protein n=1 Tax=Jatropha curcas TaxID=180498 RepID=UPI00279B87AC|nr:hypothetical protein QLP06_mgp007 [Jatropha curcas]WFG81232.1 hypothetical protein [Jatropha curcas]
MNLTNHHQLPAFLLRQRVLVRPSRYLLLHLGEHGTWSLFTVCESIPSCAHSLSSVSANSRGLPCRMRVKSQSGRHPTQWSTDSHMEGVVSLSYSPVRDCFLCAYESTERRLQSDLISSDQSITIRGCSPKPFSKGIRTSIRFYLA